MQSPEIKDLVAALIKVQAEIKQPKKTATNPHFKSKFADLGDCMDAVRDLLNKNGLVVTQLVVGSDLQTILIHTSGQYIQSSYPLGAGTTPQAVGSAITYARRYSICAMFGLVGEPDDDGNAASEAAAASRAAFVAKVKAPA